MATKAELQAELDELGVEWKAKDRLAELEAKLAEATADEPETPDEPEAADDVEEVARVDEEFVTVKGPPSFARSEWHPAFLNEPLRFNSDAKARLRVSQAGEPFVFEFMGPQGLEQVPVAEKVAEHPDLEVIE